MTANQYLVYSIADERHLVHICKHMVHMLTIYTFCLCLHLGQHWKLVHAFKQLEQTFQLWLPLLLSVCLQTSVFARMVASVWTSTGPVSALQAIRGSTVSSVGMICLTLSGVIKDLQLLKDHRSRVYPERTPPWFPHTSAVNHKMPSGKGWEHVKGEWWKL